ncbi:hypothetical protein JHJ32_06740 [Parapedobacter sp. ISTM3]|uniref:hypothetical protein n=1 Tax=Parapedobacter sp. ISTM3 TaxID=2800130 RepID=UPI001908784F|nr:hypothetical protein [Parapedobacter sp. ISTM3]MBK1439675.1 hypothetical protein [Parapedobacter sp. ISTM3]
MIKIHGTISLTKIQNLYSELASSNDAVIDVHLPKKIEKLDFGLLFSYLQFLSTWVRNNRSGKLYLPVNNTEEAIEYLDNNEFVYPSIVLAWEKEIVNANGENIKGELKNPSKEYFNRMDFFDLKGNSVPIYCFDHDKSNRGLSRHLYKNFRELVNETTLGFNLFNAFKKVGDFNKGVFRTGVKGHYDDFIAIIHELFTNTHEHAKTNELGYNLYPNIRALQLKFHKKPINKFVEQFQDYAGLVQYFNSGFNVNPQGDLYLLEISILDSGPGFVKRYKRISDYNLNIAEEVEIIKQCLYRHNTSADGFRGEIKGIGLDRVLQTLDGKGFVRIKTGRADVFRDMRNNRYHHHDNASEIQLNDFQNNSKSNFTVYPAAEGTLLSIFYPLEFNQP